MFKINVYLKAHSQRNKARDECKTLYTKIEKLKCKIEKTKEGFYMFAFDL